MKTTKETIAKVLQSGFDRSYYLHLYRQMRYAFGWPWQLEWQNAGKGDFPHFPDVMPYWQEVGLSRKIQNVAAIVLPRIVGNNPEPFINGPKLDKVARMALQSFVNTRAAQTWQADGNWGAHFARMFLDGDQLGLGFCRVGLKVNPKTKKTYVDLSHQPLCQTLWDKTERDVTRARWAACAHYLDEETATAHFGAEKAGKYLDRYGDDANSPRMMRVFEYYDIGLGKSDPTYALIAGDLSGEVLLLEENPFGILPIAHYESYSFPGTKYPVGRIVMQMATQEMLNQHERRRRQEVQRGGGFRIYDGTRLDPEDMARVEQGEAGMLVRTKTVMDQTQGPPIFEVQPFQASPVESMEYQRLLQQFHMESGISELDSGNVMSESRTLGEVQQMQGRTDQRNAWAMKQMQEAYQRVYRAVLKVAAIGDVDPVTVEVAGAAVELNNGKVFIGDLVPEHFEVLIDTKEMTVQDDVLKRAARRQELMTLLPLVQSGLVDAKWLTKELLKQAGVDDPQEAMPKDGAELEGMGMDAGMPQQMPPMPDQIGA